MSNEQRANHEKLTNEQLVIRIEAGEDVARNMEQLYSQVRRFIHTVAWKYRDSGELEDLEQEGYLALYPAIDGYDPAQGVKFLTYAEYHIRQRMQRYLQMNGKCLRLPVHCLEKLQQYKRLCNSFKLEYGREPSDREAAYLMGFTLEQIRSLKKAACMIRLGSLDAPVSDKDGGENATVGDLMASDEDMEKDALDRLQHEELAAVLWACVDELPGKEPAVIRQRYQGGMTLAEIGRQQGTTPDAVRQIHNQALRKLRNPKRAKLLRPFLPEAEEIYSMALRGSGSERFNRTWTSSTERAALRLTESAEEIQRKAWKETKRATCGVSGGV
ncbi:sigma-70 family RNA polymerase sigma factor [Lacrimispora sp. 210928-DFI.3.58]|uniref:sigma-70 family RNA polymerase sigma factor n=1 Tax=Lacrimispora sp. 210928-DFI.3.58 TaxID=2883214 RepID=UPI001D0854EF|nr:sigma-70 family RNA polymerase sigma factor [Lacrimispora sp. 210928-DFI.3.58]MCB7317152.1 sigma-70 family RNA polymerase sigma factor [Lacrimispora sp. 210928-DFI.3.58]